MARSLRSIVRTRSALRSGLLTGLAQIVLAFAAAGAGALLAHKFGRSAETDGFLGAYGVYLVLVLAAQAFRMVVVPDLTRAAAEGRLAGESRAYAVAFLALAALDSYGTAAAAFALGGIVGLVVFAALADSHGIVALAWGLAVNAGVALAIQLVALVRRGALAGAWPVRLDVLPRLWRLLQGAAVPLALQGCYLLALRFAAQLGVGSLTRSSRR